MKKFIAILLLSILSSACMKVAPGDREVETLVRNSVLSDGFGNLFAFEGHDFP